MVLGRADHATASCALADQLKSGFYDHNVDEDGPFEATL